MSLNPLQFIEKIIGHSCPEFLFDDIASLNKYSLVAECLVLGGNQLNYLRPTDFDHILEDYCSDFEQDERIPYWADIWPAAIIMANEIFSHFNFNNKPVLELGSGFGLSGLAVKLKEGTITYSDYDKNSFAFISANHYINFFEKPHIVYIDWRSPVELGTYDWIIASDLIYEKKMFSHLISCFEFYLSESGKILLTEPQRSFSQPFFNLLKARGFNYKKKVLDAKNNNRDILIAFYEIYRN